MSADTTDLQQGLQTAAPDYRDTVFLPETDFPMRAGLPQREPEWLARWERLGVYDRLRAQAGDRKPFVLHDGKYGRLANTAEIFEVGMNSAVAKLADAANRGGRASGGREPLKVLGKHPRTDAEIKLMEGRYGAYVTDGTTNATLPKDLKQEDLTLEEAAQLIDDGEVSHGLLGVQVTDANGRVTFTLIVPGCYPGRWPHIHFEV